MVRMNCVFTWVEMFVLGGGKFSMLIGRVSANVHEHTALSSQLTVLIFKSVSVIATPPCLAPDSILLQISHYQHLTMQGPTPGLVTQFMEDVFATEDRFCQRSRCQALIQKGESCHYVVAYDPTQ